MGNPVGTINGKEAFIRRIAARLGRREPLGEAPARDVRGVPEFYRSSAATRQDLIELFAAQWSALSGKVTLIPREEAAAGTADVLGEIVAEGGVSAVSVWDDPEIAALGLDRRLEELGVAVVPWREMADEAGRESPQQAGSNSSKWAGRSPLLRATERCELGIVNPDFAIANTGTLVLQAYGGRGRSVSLLPSRLLAVFPAERIVIRMGEALERLREAAAGQAGGLPSSITLITGPSRSADIENDLTIGVHGPGQVHAVILL